MPAKPQFQVILVTAPNLKIARTLTRLVLEAKTAACVNIVPRIESHYWWQGKIEQGTEVLMLMKTARRQVKALKKVILENHPYDTPEFVALPIASGSKRYLKWMLENTGSLSVEQATQ